MIRFSSLHSLLQINCGNRGAAAYTAKARGLASLPLIVSSLLLVVIFSGVASFAQTNSGNAIINPAKPLLITSSINENNLATLTGNTRPEANAKNDRGRVADSLMLHMILVLRRSPEQEKALEQFMAQQTDPASPYFHQWLTPQQLGQRYGVAQADIDKIKGWLQAHGFRVEGVHPTEMMLNISGTTGQVRQAFHTEIHILEVDGVKHHANMSDPKIPAALAPVVVGVMGLNDFMPHRQYRKADLTFSGCGKGNNCYFLTPADFATIYNLQPLLDEGYTGKGQTIYIIQDDDLDTQDDWNTYVSTFGLTQYGGSLSTTHPQSPPGWNWPCTDPGYMGGDPEPNLDVELSSAMAPGAAIVLASCADVSSQYGDTTGWTFGGYLALINMFATNNTAATNASIMSISFGDSESVEGTTANAFINSLYQWGASEGYSIFVSSGDQAAAVTDRGNPYVTHGITVSGMASTPYNVAVGGTDFSDTYSKTTSTYWSSSNGSTYGSALSYVPEIPWNGSCASVLIAENNGFSETYGTSGFCNSSVGQNSWPGITGGSGGPSACATGTPNTPGATDGTCAGYAKPSWQAVFGNPSDNVRDLPDISLFASNGIWGHAVTVCFSDTSGGGAPCTGAPSGWTGVGGTSGSAPMMAGIQAVINQVTGTAWGNPNPTYYSLAATEYSTSGNSSCNSSNGNGVASNCIFYDVTLGDTDQPCEGTMDCYLPSGTWGVLSTSDSAYQPAFAAQSGWDFATGIGTINAYNLVNAFSNGTKAATTTTVTLTPSTAVVGTKTPVTIAATVKASSGSGTPTGPVTFFNGPNLLGAPVTLTNGQASYQYDVSGLAAGKYTITAIYGVGDSNFASSTSAAQTLNVITLISTTTTMSVSATPSSTESNVGSKVTCTATVAHSSGSATPTGTVSFMNGSNVLWSGPVGSNGTVSYSWTNLAVGTYAMTAKYSGDSNYAASTSSAATVNVVDFKIAASPTTITISSPGQSGQTTLTISPLSGFNETLSYACSGLPSGATCAFAAASATTETFTISTTAPTAKLDRDPLRRNQQLFYAFLLPGFLGLVTMGGVRRKNWVLLALLLVSLVLLLPACGGGGSGSNGNGNGNGGGGGTPTGTNNVTVTATTSGAAPLSHQVTVTLTVQ
jgi:Pro-kumamolisin, activation domain/Bacterial Ig-like domain (group 3)